jgi:hypothetical protein
MLMDDNVLGIDAGHRSRDQRGAGVELIAGIDVPLAVFFHGQCVHRLERRMDVDAGEVFALDHLGGLVHRRGGVAVFDEQEAFSAFLLQPA